MNIISFIYPTCMLDVIVHSHLWIKVSMLLEKYKTSSSVSSMPIHSFSFFVALSRHGKKQG